MVRRILIAGPLILAALTGCASTPGTPSPVTTGHSTTTAPVLPPSTFVEPAEMTATEIESATGDVIPNGESATQVTSVDEPYVVQCRPGSTGETLLSDGTTGFSSDCVDSTPRITEIQLPPPPSVVPEYAATTTTTTVAPFDLNTPLPSQHGLIVTLGTTCVKGSTGHTREGLTAYCVPAPGEPSFGYYWVQ